MENQQQQEVIVQNTKRKLKIFTSISIGITTLALVVAVYGCFHKEKVVKFITTTAIRYISGTGNIDYSNITYKYDQSIKSLKVNIENLIFKEDESVKFIIYNLKTTINFSDLLKGYFAPRYTEIDGGVLYLSRPESSKSSKAPNLKWVKNLIKTIPEDQKEIFVANNLYIKAPDLETLLIKQSSYKTEKVSEDQTKLKGNLITVYNKVEYNNSVKFDYFKKNYI